jgi:hypothetical protein
MPENAITSRIREDKILRCLVEGTMSETGSEFFHALARNLSEALQTCGAWITEYLPETRRLRALAFWLNGGFLENYEHTIDGTPCQKVIETKSRAHFPERLLEFFPTEPDLAALGAASYMGTPLLDADGTLLGHLAVLDNRPMPAEPHLYELFDLFAVRAVAELRRLRAEAARREREAQLSLLLDTGNDVTRFDVPVNEFLPVDRSKTGSDLGRNFQRQLYLKPPRAFDEFFECFSLYKLHSVEVILTGSAQM